MNPFCFDLFKSTKASNTIGMAKRMMITAPITTPIISPAPTFFPTTTDDVLTEGLVDVDGISGTSVPIGQSGSLRVSREVSQVGSRWRREDWTMMEALPLAIQDCILVTRSGALYTSVPAILPR